jgi:hypothetical protein
MTEVFNLFDKFTIESCEELDYHFDGQVGKRVLFIQNQSKDFLVSFEEGMECFDLKSTESSMVDFGYRNGDKYIHQRRTPTDRDVRDGSFAFFRIELKTPTQETVALPGQMVLLGENVWVEDVEPVLKVLLEKIEISK